MPRNALDIVQGRAKEASGRLLEKSLKRPPKRTKGEVGNFSVSMKNELANAAHRLSLTEKRLMMMAVAKLDSRKRTDPLAYLTVTVTAKEYADLYKVTLSTAYTELKAAADRLLPRIIGWSSKYPVKSGPQGGDHHWIAGRDYHAGEGWVSMVLNVAITPYLTALQGQFVSYKLAQASALRSVYSWRLLELLSQYRDSGWRQDDIADFVHAMEVPEAYAKNFAQLRRWVIEPAVKELTEKDGWQIDWKPLKLGRKVTGLRFEFQRHPQAKLPL